MLPSGNHIWPSIEEADNDFLSKHKEEIIDSETDSDRLRLLKVFDNKDSRW